MGVRFTVQFCDEAGQELFSQESSFDMDADGIFMNIEGDYILTIGRR